MSESAELSLDAPVFVNPVYSFMEILPQQGQTFTLGGSALPAQFKIPQQTVFNLAESYLEFDLTVGATAATAGHTTITHVSKWPFDSAVLRAGSTVLGEIQDLDIYTKSIVPFTMPLNKYNTRAPVRNSDTIANSMGLNMGCQPLKSSDPNLLAAAAVADLQLCGRYITTAATSSGAAPAVASGQGDESLSRQQVTIGVDNAPQAYKNMLAFGDLSHSIFALNKNLFFGDSPLELVMTTSIKDKICYTSVNGAAATPAIGAANPIVSAGALTLTNMILYLAVETMPQNIQNIQDKYRSGGLQIMTPFVNSFKTGLGVGTTASLNQSISNGHGIALSRIYNVFYNTANSIRTAACVENVAASKIQYYQSRLGSKYLQPARVDSAANQDWKYHRAMLEGSALCSDRSWKINYVLCDNFASSKPAIEWNKEDEEIGGIALSGTSLSYYLQVTKTAVDQTLNTYAITSTAFNVSPAGVFRSAQLM